MQNEEKVILCLVRDLLFYSKIRAAAEMAGAKLKGLREASKLSGEIGIGLVVDLNQPDALQAAAQWRHQNNLPVVGFVSHVDVDTINSARFLGIDRILARSQFEQRLPEIFNQFGKPPAAPDC